MSEEFEKAKDWEFKACAVCIYGKFDPIEIICYCKGEEVPPMGCCPSFKSNENNRK